MKPLAYAIRTLVCIAIGLHAPTFGNSQGMGFGLRGGVNFQNINGKDVDGNTLKNDLLIGFHGGLFAEIPIVPQFYFQPALLYSTKGAKVHDEFAGQDFTSTVKIAYIELPLNFLFKPMLGAGHLLLGLGPYVAYGIGGTVKYDGNLSSLDGDIEFKNKVTVSDPNDVYYLRRLDFGANLLAGYEFANKISFQLNAQLGMTKINPEYEGLTDDKTSLKNTGFGLSLGYRF